MSEMPNKKNSTIKSSSSCLMSLRNYYDG